VTLITRALAGIGALGMLASLAACGQEGASDQAAGTTAANKALPTSRPTLAALASGETTPNKDRIATLGLLNKRNNITRDIVIKVGEQQRLGNVIVRLQSCERTAPWEMPEEIGAFAQVLVLEPPQPGADPVWRRVFSGWLFRNSPALNVVEHPVYDVWVKTCAMNFPGEEARPASAAPAKSAPKASGNDSADEPAPVRTPAPASPAPVSESGTSDAA
jgi:hypothetical protein